MQSTFVLAKKKPRRVRMMSSSRPFCQILSPSILTLHFELPYLENKGIVQFVVMTINDYLLKRECNQSTKPHFIFFAVERRSITGGHGKLNLCEKSMCQDG